MTSTSKFTKSQNSNRENIRVAGHKGKLEWLKPPLRPLIADGMVAEMIKKSSSESLINSDLCKAKHHLRGIQIALAIAASAPNAITKYRRELLLNRNASRRILSSIDDIRLRTLRQSIKFQVHRKKLKQKRKSEAVACTERKKRPKSKQFVATFKLNYSFRYAKSMRCAMRRWWGLWGRH